MFSVYSRAAYLFSTAAMMIPAVALAQSIPSTVDPGQTQKRLERMERQPSATGGLTLPDQGVSDVSGMSDQKVFTLNSVQLEGSSVYKMEDFSGLYSGLVGKQVSHADLAKIAQDMTARYRNDGYVLSRVILPPQKIQNGSVVFQAVEGVIDAVQIEGDIKGDKALLEKYAEKIKAERPATSATMERYLLLMDDLPGVTARSVIKPSATTPQASTMIITLEHDSFEGDVSIDNRGNRFLGPYQLTGVAAFNSAMGMYERNTFRGIATAELDELFYGEFTHEHQLGSEGTRLNLRAAATRVEPGGRLESLDIQGDTQLLEMGISHPLIRSRERNLEIQGNLRAQNSKSDILNSELFDDKVRTLTLGLTYDRADQWNGVNLLGVSASQGLDILGATDDGIGRSRITGEHNFTRFNANLSRLQSLNASWSAYVSAEGQYTSDSLLNQEQFAIGGPQIGRAYDGTELTGDKGISGVAELRYDFFPQVSWVQGSQLFAYYDIGSVWLNDPIFGEEEQASLASTGLGLRFNLVNGMSGSAMVGFPLTRDVVSEGDDDPRFFFSLLKRF